MESLRRSAIFKIWKSLNNKLNPQLNRSLKLQLEFLSKRVNLELNKLQMFRSNNILIGMVLHQKSEFRLRRSNQKTSLSVRESESALLQCPQALNLKTEKQLDILAKTRLWLRTIRRIALEGDITRSTSQMLWLLTHLEDTRNTSRTSCNLEIWTGTAARWLWFQLTLSLLESIKCLQQLQLRYKRTCIEHWTINTTTATLHLTLNQLLMNLSSLLHQKKQLLMVREAICPCRISYRTINSLEMQSSNIMIQGQCF